MNIKFTRKQELALIEMGLKSLLERMDSEEAFTVARKVTKKIPWNKGKKKGTNGHKWGPEQRAKFSATMKKKWAGRSK